MALNYLVREPKEIKTTNPAIFLMHGYGSNEEDLFSFAAELPSEYYVFSLQAPHPMMYGGYAWYAINFDAAQNKFSDIAQAKESQNLIKNTVEEIIEKYFIDSEKITLIGFSQGAILSYALALSTPHIFKRIVALSGYISEDMISISNDKEALSKLKIYGSHGTVDQVIPIDWARKTKPFLEKLNISMTYSEYPVGHTIAYQNFYEFVKWLENNP